MYILPLSVGENMRRRGLNFRRRKKKVNLSALQGVMLMIGEVILAFLIGCMVVWFFGYTLSNVGESMEPTLKSGDRVLINRLVYQVKSPSYGDLIVFKPNGNENAHYYIKRVVGKPGDTVTIQSGRVFVNGELLNETVQTESMQDAGLAEDGVKLGEDEYFVLGDNRNNSEDSRSANIGNIKKDDILGKAWFVVTPGDRFGRLK